MPPKGEDIILQGWQPIPDDQTTLAEMMQAAGYGTYFVTDNMHQFKPSYDIHRGFDVFDFFRGQTTDNYKPIWTAPEGQGRPGPREGQRSRHDGPDAPVLRQRAGQEDGGRLVLPDGLYPGRGVPRAPEQGRAFLPYRGQLRPARALGPAREVRRDVRRRAVQPQGAVLGDLRPERLPGAEGAREDEGALLRRR